MAVDKMMDLSNFGSRELSMAKDILDALMNNGYPDDFYEDDVSIAFNPNSGYVFLTNSEYQSAIEVDGKLEMWYYLSYAGTEGTAEDLYDKFKDGDIDEEDYEELAEIFDRNGMGSRAEEVRSKMNR